MKRTRPSRGVMNCYRCLMESERAVKACPRCGCVAFFSGQRLPRVFCPAFEEFEKRPSALEIALDYLHADRYLDEGQFESGKRLAHKPAHQ